MLPEEGAPNDLVIRSPNAVHHGISRTQGEDDPENWIMRSHADGCWYVQADDSKAMEYVSEEWVRCWFIRCSYFGLVQLLGKDRRTRVRLVG